MRKALRLPAEGTWTWGCWVLTPGLCLAFIGDRLARFIHSGWSVSGRGCILLSSLRFLMDRGVPQRWPHPEASSLPPGVLLRPLSPLQGSPSPTSHLFNTPIFLSPLIPPPSIPLRLCLLCLELFSAKGPWDSPTHAGIPVYSGQWCSVAGTAVHGPCVLTHGSSHAIPSGWVMGVRMAPRVGCRPCHSGYHCE